MMGRKRYDWEQEYQRLTSEGRIEHKSFPMLITKIDEAQGIVDAIVNVFGMVDEGDDVIRFGAFTQTITENMAHIRVLDNHDTTSVLSAIGRPLAIKQLKKNELPSDIIQKFPDATGALYTSTQFMMDDPTSVAVFRRLKAGVICEWSIGFQAFDITFEDGVRYIGTVKLWEYSPVLWGMNQATLTVGVKSQDQESITVNTKKALPFHSLPLADRNHAWTASTAKKNVLEWAGGADNTKWSKYAQAFFYVDEGNAEIQGGYKLPYADVIDGTLTAIPKGIFAAAAVMSGARGGADVGGDESAIQAVIGKWYKKMAKEFDDETIVAPWDKEKGDEPADDQKAMTANGPQKVLGDYYAANVCNTMHMMANSFLSSGFIDTETHDAMMRSTLAVKQMCYDSMGDCADMPMTPSGGGGGGWGMYNTVPTMLLSLRQRLEKQLPDDPDDPMTEVMVNALSQVEKGLLALEQLLTSQDENSHNEGNSAESVVMPGSADRSPSSSEAQLAEVEQLRISLLTEELSNGSNR